MLMFVCLHFCIEKYVIYTKSSSWLDNLWSMASQMFCESILFPSELRVHGFDVSPEPGVAAEYERLEREYERPSFLIQPYHRYARLERQCVELKQFGTLNKKTKWKHVLFPVSLWDKIHALNLSPESFYNTFGIQIYENGWERYCDRYTVRPFDTDLDVGV